MPVGRLAHTFATTFDWRRNLHGLATGWVGLICTLPISVSSLASSPLFGAKPHYCAIASQQGLDYQLLTLADLLRLSSSFYGEWGRSRRLDNGIECGGGGRIRTFEVDDGRFTVCSFGRSGTPPGVIHIVGNA